MGGILQKQISIVFCVLLIVLSTSLHATAQQPPDLTGNLSFNVGSESGRVERLVITIGDGGTGAYKATASACPQTA